MGLKENGKRKTDPACRMFLLNSVKHKKIGNAYINERGQFIHLSVSTVKLFSISPVWYHQRNVIIMWTDMVGSRSVLVQTANIHPLAPPPNTHTRTLTKVHVRIKPTRPTPLLQTIPTVFVKYSMLNAEQISALSYQRKAGNSAVNTDYWEIKLFPFSSFMDFLRFPEFTIEPQWTVVVTETLYF